MSREENEKRIYTHPHHPLSSQETEMATTASTRKISILGKEEVDRGHWAGPFDFLMSMIAYAVGLGNVWRFPYLCFKNGGGSFLVVYALFFTFAAVPIFVMEVTVGQYLQRGFRRRVLMQSSSFTDFGGIQWELCGLMLLSWMIVYFALWKGITNARKFVYFCALFPYLLIGVLLIRGLTLPGAWTGLSFYLTPNITKLSDTTVWKDAGTQVFYSYGVGFGTLIALGSHNKLNHNCYRDAIVMCFINGGTSLLAGTAVFSILGYMSVVANKNIAEIVKPGVGLAFLAYPEVASNLPLKQLWAFLFFLMILILALDSQVGMFTALEDTFPILLRKHKKKSLLACCIFFFILGIPMVSYAGAHWLTLVDAYGSSGIALLFVVFFEVVGLSWGFGAHRVVRALREMVGFSPCPIFPYLWKYTAPFASAALFITCCVMYQPLSYPWGESYPMSVELFGLFLSSCSMVVIPGYAIYYLFFSKDERIKGLSVVQKFFVGIHPPPNFGLNNGQELDCIDNHATKSNANIPA